MLDNLKDGLRSAIKKIVSSSGIDEELIKELAKDVQRSLLQSDVNVKLVLEITKISKSVVSTKLRHLVYQEKIILLKFYMTNYQNY